MAISKHVRGQLFHGERLTCIPMTRRPSGKGSGKRRARHGVWTKREHARFLEALDKFPDGPWKAIAAHVGSKTARQAMTHGQKYRQKIARRQRGLKKHVRDLGDSDDEMEAEDTDEVEQQSLEQQSLEQAVECVEERPSIEAPVLAGLSVEQLAAYIANMDAQISPVLSASDSPLFVPDTPVDNNLGGSSGLGELDDGFSLDALVLEAPTSTSSATFASAPADADLELPLPQQMHHLAVIMRADMASGEAISPLLLAALHRSNPSIEPLAFDAVEREGMAPYVPLEGELSDEELGRELMLALTEATPEEELMPLDAPFLL